MDIVVRSIDDFGRWIIWVHVCVWSELEFGSWEGLAQCAGDSTQLLALDDAAGQRAALPARAPKPVSWADFEPDPRSNVVSALLARVLGVLPRRMLPTMRLPRVYRLHPSESVKRIEDVGDQEEDAPRRRWREGMCWGGDSAR